MQNYFSIGVYILNQCNIAKSLSQKNIAIIGGGPAGLVAAEVIASAGHAVSVYDAMPSVGRKFLLAGVGGMNITHAEPEEKFLSRYAAHPQFLETIHGFNASALREWIHGLGIETFVGSSGRVFPRDMKAAPLLRVWLHRLRGLGVNFFPRHRWVGWNNGKLHFLAQDQINSNEKLIEVDAVVLALGGASWRRLGSDGAWVGWLAEQGIRVNALQPSNCGFEAHWSESFREQYAGAQLHGVGLSADGKNFIRSEAIISTYGIEGTGVYALSGNLRRELNRSITTQLIIDLLPDMPLEKIQQRLTHPRGKNSLSNFLRKQLNLPPVKIALLRELTDKSISDNPSKLAAALKSVAVPLIAMRPIDEAISTAGGIDFAELDANYMLKKLPGVFAAGEMLDWDAPTGGYLLTGCFATGRAAGQGLLRWIG
jgi:hypothetical protein